MVDILWWLAACERGVDRGGLEAQWWTFCGSWQHVKEEEEEGYTLCDVWQQVTKQKGGLWRTGSLVMKAVRWMAAVKRK